MTTATVAAVVTTVTTAMAAPTATATMPTAISTTTAYKLQFFRVKFAHITPLESVDGRA